MMPSSDDAAEDHDHGSPRESRPAYAVLVLYGLSPEESPAFRSLCTVLESEFSGAIPLRGLLLYDNSPLEHALPKDLPAGLQIRYQHDPANPGLARPYQIALGHAQAAGTPWLLLLDQDTVVTAAWLNEAIPVARASERDSTIAAVVPRLLQDGLALSPHRPLWSRSGPLDYSAGLKEPPLKVFNSGALLRVTALLACGGFPQEFPLDCLDHAVFFALEQRGGRMYLLASALEHQLASKHLDKMEDFGRSSRLQSSAAAESRFYRRFGTPYEKLRHVLQRGRLIVRLLLAAKLGDALTLMKLTVRS